MYEQPQDLRYICHELGSGIFPPSIVCKILTFFLSPVPPKKENIVFTNFLFKTTWRWPLSSLKPQNSLNEAKNKIIFHPSLKSSPYMLVLK